MKSVPNVIRACLAVTLVTCLPAFADIVDSGKAATALVDLDKLGSASAFCIDPSGVFVTNDHVVSHLAADATAKLVMNAGQPDERVLKAKVVKRNSDFDLALLQVQGNVTLPTLPLGHSADLRETAELTTFGYPFGRSLSLNKDGYPAISVSLGRINALRKEGDELALIQIDAVLNPGNSGGPVLDGEGRVIGVVVSGIPGANVNFAIAVDRLREFLRQPRLRVDAPVIQPAGQSLMTVHVATAKDELAPTSIEVRYGVRQDRMRTIKADKLSADRYQAPIDLKGLNDDADWLWITAETGGMKLTGLLVNRDVKVGDQTIPLSDVSEVNRSDAPDVVTVLKSGKTLRGEPTDGLAFMWIDLPGRAAAYVDLRQTQRWTVGERRTAAPYVDYEVIARLDDKVIGSLKGRLSVAHADPANHEYVLPRDVPPVDQGVEKLTFSAYIDGRTDLYITPIGLYWKHYKDGRPGATATRDLGTRAGDQVWTPRWGRPYEIGPEYSTLWPVDFRTTQLEFELLAVGSKPDAEGMVPRGKMQLRRESDILVASFDDSAPGAAWYRFEIRRLREAPPDPSNLARRARVEVNDSQGTSNPARVNDGKIELGPGRFWCPGSRKPKPDTCSIVLPEPKTIGMIRLAVPIGTKTFADGREPLDYTIESQFEGKTTELLTVKDGKHPSSEVDPSGKIQTITFKLDKPVKARRVTFKCTRTSGKNYGPLIYEFEVHEAKE